MEVGAGVHIMPAATITTMVTVPIITVTSVKNRLLATEPRSLSVDGFNIPFKGSE